MARYRAGRMARGRIGIGVILAVWVVAGLTIRSANAQGGGGSAFRPDASVTAELLLRNAEAHITAGHASEAIEIYQRVIREHAGSVARVPREGGAAGLSGLYVDVRREIQRRVASLPPEARTAYRRRVDPQAERWYREGSGARDRALLRRVVEEAFSSSYGDDALDLLGDLAFRAGRFEEALVHYRRLVPDPNAPASDLVHPDPDVDLARVAAKILLCRAALGESPPRADFETYAERFPDAEGDLAGRSGLYLRSVIEAVRSDGLGPATSEDGRWPTFAGTMRRTKIGPTAIDIGSLQWHVPLPAVAPANNPAPFLVNRLPRPSRPDQGLAYHPIILGDQIVVAEPERLVAYNLGERIKAAPEADRPGLSGEVPVAWDQPLPTAAFSSPRGRLSVGTPRYTLTAHKDHIYARLGPPRPQMGPSYLFAVKNNRDVEGKLIWMRRATDIELPEPRKGPSRLATFEGSPVADDRGVYVAITEVGTMLTSYVACLDPETGEPRWVRYVGEASVPIDVMNSVADVADMGTRLLSLDGTTLYYQTNLGALAALDVETGGLRWLATYPVGDARPGAIDRDLNPAIVAGGLVYVAPDDAPEIFAFDATTGRLAWKSQPLPEVTHLLGVARGRLIATGNRVWSLDAGSGDVIRYWPDAGAGFQGFGRGLLAGEFIYWPTKNEIHVLDQGTGLRADRGPIPLQEAFGTGGGNLAAGDGYLVIAQEDRLVILCQNARLIDRYRELIAAAPEQAAHYVRLARVAEAVGDLGLALENLDAAIGRAGEAETLDGQSLMESAQAQRHRVLMRLGTEAGDAGRWEEATRRFAAASAGRTTDRESLTARLRLAEALERSGRDREAVSLLQGLLSEDRYRGLSVAADPVRTIRADRLIAERLDALLRDGGRELYAEHEARARALLDRGRDQQDPRLLSEVVVSYPAARAAGEALLALGELWERRANAVEAARAYRRLLAGHADDPMRARALLGLGRAYEIQGLATPAREVYRLALSRHGELSLDEEAGRTVAEIVADRLASADFLSPDGALEGPELPVPLGRAWSTRWDSEVRPLRAVGTPPGAGALFLASRGRLSLVDVGTGALSWTAELEGEPRWVGCLADRVVVATADRLMGLDLARGSPLWTLDPADSDAGPVGRRPNPFAGTRPVGPTPVGSLDGLKLVGDRIFCLRGGRELLAVDGDSGLIDWTFTPPGGTINAHFRADSGRLVVQTREPNFILVLDSANGQVRSEFAQGESDPGWVREPLALDDDHLAVVIEPRTVALIDLGKGDEVWTYHEPSVLPRGGPPRLLVDSGRLLVLRDGSELVRIDPATGRGIWSRLLGIEDLSDHADALVLDEEHIYCATGPNPILTAYSMTDGSVAWRRHLIGPSAGWAVALAGGLVAAYPNPKRSAEGEIPGLALVLCRRDDGRLVQRLVFAAPVTDLTVRLAAGSAWIATQGHGWALGPTGSMDDVSAEPR